jgi:hypothetical protein
LPAGTGLAHWQKKSRCLAAGAQPYELPVAKWNISGDFSNGPTDGRKTVSGVYVFWFVADGEETPDTSPVHEAGWRAICCAPAFCSAGPTSRIFPRANRGRKTRRLRAWKN